MILYLADRRRALAYFMLTVFYFSTIISSVGRVQVKNEKIFFGGGDYTKQRQAYNRNIQDTHNEQLYNTFLEAAHSTPEEENFEGKTSGPSQPEMSSFKTVGTDNMVNLFSGDFNYNIPLMDVGGYPINIFYDGGVGLEQEASWVGLGWNINPGCINRNMRGIPDDFNGTEQLKQIQDMKPNRTWGVNIGSDLELLGIKNAIDLNATLGMSFNNYLGPALDLGIKGGVGFKIAKKANAEKTADTSNLSLRATLSANLNSRYGLTVSPSVSLTANSFLSNRKNSFGVGLSTSYNSRTGIKALQISEQVEFNRIRTKEDAGKYHGKQQSSRVGENIFESSISFAKPSYTPSIRMPMANKAFSGHFQLGAGIFGLASSIDAEVYQQMSRVSIKEQHKPMLGYMYYHKALDNKNAVTDFTRFNDNEVTGATPIISAPQYSYDVFSIQGEGTGGTIRAYRNDLGYVRDNYTRSEDDNVTMGADISGPGHYGANFNIVKTPTYISEWGNGNKLRNNLQFAASTGNTSNVYFRNPGESSVLEDNQYDKIGGTDLVRFKLGTNEINPTVEPQLERFSKAGTYLGSVNINSTAASTERKKRSQVTSFLTATEAGKIGLDTKIKSYDANDFLTTDGKLKYTEYNRVNESEKKFGHHISQINVTESDGKRYIYGIPVYNIIQRDFTFSVDGTETEEGKVAVASHDYMSTSSPLLSTNNSAGRDGYLQVTETPPYAHSYLLSGLLSPDYVDVTGNGITEDDLGDAVKFNYTRIKTGSDWAVRKWRTPMSTGNEANFNDGNRTERKDDKGIISYGERESWYTHSIESKTMIAFFILDTDERQDAKGATGEDGGIDANDHSAKKLKEIRLYNKSDLKKNGYANAKPVKTVVFSYNYSLCKKTKDNLNTSNNGKLTLESIHFTFNGQERGNKNKYVFSYTDNGIGNPDYEPNGSDRWGTYKPSAENPASMKNADYPYTLQDKSKSDEYAGAWSLKKILLPSGGQIEVGYESDDYAFVQNKRASDMMQVVGLGQSTVFSQSSNKLYNITGTGITDNNYVFVRVPDACTNADIKEKYLQGQTQLAFKLAVNMPKGKEFVRAYATITACGVDATVSDHKTIWLQLNPIDGGLNPLSLSTIEYLREQLPGQAFPGYDVSESSGLKQAGDVLVGMLVGLKSAFKNPVTYLRSQGGGQTIIAGQSFVRLNDPLGRKLGGGQRVKSVKLKDNWNAMTGQYTSVYEQRYDYTTTEVFNGAERVISSGVAAYEPSLGGEENPFQTIVQVASKLPLGPSSYGAIEMPVLDAFFPAASVGYSKVTVKSVPSVTPDNPEVKKSRSGIGRQVTEFYTAKDFPIYYSYTSFDPASAKEAHHGSTTAFFYKYAFDSRALSQGFLVASNDMHGKMKSQSSYAENDLNTRINYTENFYSNTGSKGLDEKFDFVHVNATPDASKNINNGIISKGNMGIDIELMTDTREFSVKSTSLEIQGQLDLFPVVFPFWLPFVWPVVGNSENTYRAVTTTKVINYHSILDSVVVIDKGSQVSTKNIAYDAETGDVIVNRTNNEFDQPIYSTSYPAWWAYSGMGLAYKNIDAFYEGVNFADGKITNTGFDQSVFESGDELFIIDNGSAPSSGCNAVLASGVVDMLWVFNKNKNTTALTTAQDLVFMDAKGKLYTRDNVSFRIVRSGKRNMLSAKVAGVTSMLSPITTGTVRKLVIGDNHKVINASASEYKEKWQTDNDLIYKMAATSCTGEESFDCNGYLEKSINPYRKGLIGNFRPNRSFVFYDKRTESNPFTNTNLPQNGFLNQFKLYWDFNKNRNSSNNDNNLVADPDIQNSKWVWNSEITRVNARGMELENQNALKIYTAAQYGYNKTLPVAIGNNTTYKEMGYEGFEDADYNETLNNVELLNCSESRHYNLNSDASLQTNGYQIINASTVSINAHTGKKVLKASVGESNISNNGFKVVNNTSQNFALSFTSDITKSLIDYGGNAYGTISSNGGGTSSPTFTDLGMNFDFLVNTEQTQFNYELEGNTSQYTKIITPANYSFSLYIMPANGSGLDATANMTLKISNLEGNVIRTVTLSCNNSNVGNTCTYNASVYLCPGTYLVETICNETVNVLNTSTLMPTGFQTRFLYSSNTNTISYKSITTQNGCTFTKPIAGSPEMLNPVFTLSPNKKMIFSSWVRENCAIPCTIQTYTNSSVKFKFLDANDNQIGSIVNFLPSGPIIEGWQKIEGEFTPPTSATKMQVILQNNTGAPNYWDDIRIHPYNANMKSYVYDPINLRLVAELDANNYASFYEYDEEGTLIRTKAETKEGIKTINETRSAKQKNITTIQQ